MSYEIQSITFLEDGLVVQYFDATTDVRVKGALMKQNQLTMSAKHPDYRADLEALHHQAVRVLRNALDDFAESDPYLPTEPDDAEKEAGMGSHV